MINSLIGKKFGDWIVIKPGVKPKTLYCECRCGYCNNIKRDVLEKNLIGGRSKGCGIKSKVFNGKANKKQNIFKELVDGYEIHCKNKVAIIDKGDYDKAIKYKWNLHTDAVNTYLRAYKGYKENGVKEYIFLHNLIMDNLDKNFIIDHIDGNTLNNRKNNLRKCDLKRNEINKKKPINNTSGHKGVSYSSIEKRWKAYITHNNKRIHLGTFVNKEDAVKTRKEAENKYFKEFNRGGLNE